MRAWQFVGGCVAGAVVLGGFGIVGPAEAATPPAPGILTTADLPAGYQQAGTPQSYANFNFPVTDAASCTETPRPVPDVGDTTVVSFSPPGTPTTTFGISESALTFPSAKAAKAVFKARAANEAVRLRCAAVGFIPPGATAPIATLHYAKTKVPKVGGGSFASTGSYGATTGSSAVTFVSGAYVVGIGVAGEPFAPSASELKTILKNAERRLKQGP